MTKRLQRARSSIGFGPSYERRVRILVKSGDILEEAADVLVCSANVYLNMSGGVNGAILLKGGLGVQHELHDYLSRSGRKWVSPGTVVRTGPGPLHVRHILHAVAVDGFYRTGVDLVARTIETTLAEAAGLGARSVALTALATGYGRMTLEEFGRALRLIRGRAYPSVEELRVVVRREADAAAIRAALTTD